MKGIRPNGVILYRSEFIKGKSFIVMMESITEKEEERIDKSSKYYGEIRHVKDDGTIISAKDIYLYGEVDFNKEDDLLNIERFNLIDNNIEARNLIYANFNFDKGSFKTVNGVAKTYPTWNPILWFMYNYVLIGKPERIIVYRKIIKK